MAKKPASFEYNGTLVKVLDGDTIDCYIDLGFDLKIKKRIRYMGIDTWESRTRDKEEKVKGLAAKARNKELLEQNAAYTKELNSLIQNTLCKMEGGSQGSMEYNIF